MRISIMTIGLVLLSVVIFIPKGFAQLSADQVVEKMDNREDGDTARTDTTMILINQSKQQRVRKIKNIRKDIGEDSKGIIFFLSPADVRNTAYLSYDWEDNQKEDDSWLYLPAIQKVKRIASSDKSSSFMGSDFSYSDINGIEIEDWNYSFVNEEAQLDGHPVWIIQGKPKPELKEKVIDETGYIKSMMWIRKDNFMMVKGKYWVQKGRQIKYFKAEDIRQVQGIWTAHVLKMVTTAKGKVTHSSVLRFSNIKYNEPVDDLMFTTRRMEQGL